MTHSHDDGDPSWEEALREAFGTSPNLPTTLGEETGVTAEAPACGRFQIESELARGGVGIIWRAFDPSLTRHVAIKSLRPELTGNPEMTARFLNEAQIGGQLQHPGIVPVHDVGLDQEDRPYFAMKLIGGRNLGALLGEHDRQREDLTRWLHVFRQVCQTMAYAHSRGVVHRDLKPANVMVGAFGEVQVVDWGLAKVLTDSTRERPAPDRPRASPQGQTAEPAPRNAAPPSASEHPPLTPGTAPSQAGSIVGTPGYMAPEQGFGEVGVVDTRADVFGLGAILFHILVGEPPAGSFPNSNAMRESILADLRRLDALDLDATLATLARSCLDPAPTARPADASAVNAAIGNYLASMEKRAHRDRVTAAAAQARAESERRARRRTLALASLVLMAMAAALLVVLRSQSEHQRRLQELRYTQKQAAGAVAEGSWSVARALLLQAVGIAETEQEPAITASLHAELARVEKRLRDARTADRLLLIRSDAAPSGRLHRDLSAAVLRYGVDLQRSPSEVRRQLDELQSTLHQDIARALETIALRRGQRPDAASKQLLESLLPIADAIDPDPLRTRIRSAARTRDRETLRAMATTAGAIAAEGVPENAALESPPKRWSRTNKLLLARALQRNQLGWASRQLLLSIVRDRGSQRADLWTHIALADSFVSGPNIDTAAAQRHFDVAAALHPSPGWGQTRRRDRPREEATRQPQSAGGFPHDRLLDLLARRDFPEFARLFAEAQRQWPVTQPARRILEIALRDARDDTSRAHDRLRQLLRPQRRR